MWGMILRWPMGLALCAALAMAQDAGLVLRTSVGYGTMKASAPLTPEQKEEADRLATAARQAAGSGQYGEALRHYQHGFAVMQGAAWTPALEAASALQAKADHALAEAGRTVRITLTPLYAAEKAPALSAAVILHPDQNASASGDQVLAAKLPIPTAAGPTVIDAKLPATAAGNYQLIVRLTEPGAAADRLPTGAVKTVPIHVEALTAAAEALRSRLAAVKDRQARALPSAEYALALYERADRGDTNPHQYDFRREFASATALLDAIDAGKDPLATAAGDVRRAYRSKVDGSLQPYRVFVPAHLNPDKAAPLVVALHGMGGDENSMFDAYAAGAIKREAEKHGFIVVCPKGREPAAMYRGTAEQDVLDVLAEVRRTYNIDADRVYLMGHSMGGYGTWSTAMDHPDLFAALGPIAGGGNPAGMVKIKHIPQYVVHGDADKTVPVTQSRGMVEAGRKAGAKIEYVEIPGGSHGNVVVPQFGPMFDFFAQQKRTREAN